MFNINISIPSDNPEVKKIFEEITEVCGELLSTPVSRQKRQKPVCETSCLEVVKGCWKCVSQKQLLSNQQHLLNVQHVNKRVVQYRTRREYHDTLWYDPCVSVGSMNVRQVIIIDLGIYDKG